jgi:hypothetical protein
VNHLTSRGIDARAAVLLEAGADQPGREVAVRGGFPFEQFAAAWSAAETRRNVKPVLVPDS